MKKLILAFLLIILLAVGYLIRKQANSNSLSQVVVGRSSAGANQLGWLVNACRHQAGDGFGHAVVAKPVTIQASGRIDQPCKIVLKSGASLTLKNAHLITQNIYISSDDGSANRLTVQDSQLSGYSSGFQASLNNRGSRVEVINSRLQYGLSVGLSVGSGDGDNQAQLAIKNSKLSTTDSDSEGIFLVSTGWARLSGNHFDAKSGSATLLAGSCQNAKNIGLKQHCQAQ